MAVEKAFWKTKMPWYTHGQAIYLYTHIHTNQVVYSLTRAMDNTRTLKQLTFYGKKTVPAALRRDVWRPYAVVSLPRALQPVGLSTYHYLREFRTLRDYCWTWTPPPDSEHPTALPSRKDRSRWLMDQRATSVADLAAALTRALRVRSHEPARMRHQRAQDRRAWAELQAWAKRAESEELAIVEKRLAGLVKEMKGSTDRPRAERRVREVRARRNRLVRAREALAYVDGKPAERRDRWSKTMRVLIAKRAWGYPAEEVTEEQMAEAVVDSEDGVIPPAPYEPVRPWTENEEDMEAAVQAQTAAEEAGQAEADAAPEPTVPENAIRIKWTDLRDAEYAAEWPASVYHEWMGIMTRRTRRFTAPKPKWPPVLEIKGKREKRERVDGEGKVEKVDVERKMPVEEEKKGVLGWIKSKVGKEERV
ncbi:hypothetical protein EJ06DRAFT_550834 [Trichodelitschia bisporula]|uniref:Large ribosomal subunit protein mL67 n=1 Tax=Trichodelitschia bisporula TaxID=703511 RepID=A0A6G1HPF3_9PEZI|nr:hypothetical protein EJ06DRAFT_550834 [Trichodelitschia bisporula]